VTGDPFKVLVSPNGARLYVLTNADKVFAIDLATGATVGQLAFPATPNGLAITADGSKLYVSTRAAGTVVEVDTRTMTALRSWAPGGTVQEVVLAPGGAEMYVVNEEGSWFDYNLTTGALVATLALGNGPFGMALTPDGTMLFVSVMRTGEVKVIDRAARAVSRTLFVDGTPRRVAFRADGTAVVANEAGYVSFVR
jgi:DNA-binding beta-propeller fold protein YncE